MKKVMCMLFGCFILLSSGCVTRNTTVGELVDGLVVGTGQLIVGVENLFVPTHQ